MAGALDRDRHLLELMDLEHMTEKEEAWIIRRLDSARRRERELGFTNPEQSHLLAARLDALRRHFTRRRLRVLPGGRLPAGRS